VLFLNFYLEINIAAAIRAYNYSAGRACVLYIYIYIYILYTCSGALCDNFQRQLPREALLFHSAKFTRLKTRDVATDPAISRFAGNKSRNRERKTSASLFFFFYLAVMRGMKDLFDDRYPRREHCSRSAAETLLFLCTKLLSCLSLCARKCLRVYARAHT